METIAIPSKIEVSESSKDRAKFIVEPCYPGYGTTLGNALRRVLLSSLQGAAITAAKIEGVDHEFSTIPFVKEDLVSIILNLKLLRFKLFTEEPVTLTLDVKGEKTVTGADLKVPSDVEVVSTKQTIASLTDKAAHVAMEVRVQRGRGYVPVESREKERLEVGWIAIDAVYTPVKTVNFSVEHVRVGQITNYDRLVLDVETDGTIQPVDAVTQSAQILVDHFNAFLATVKGKDAETATPPKKRRAKSKKDTEEKSAPPPSGEEPSNEGEHAAS